LILFSLNSVTALCQTGFGMEQSLYYTQHAKATWVPVINYQSKRGWYGEARYNYEDLKTGSLHLGKTFSKEGKLSYTITPLAGGLFGQADGFSLGSNVELDWKNFNWFTQTQYVFSSQDFIYTWSELFYSPTKWVYVGAALQHTKLQGEDDLWEPGAGLGFSYKNFSLTVYDFIALPTKQQTFVLSLIFEKKQ
jgi:hypothetical protein